MIEVEGQAILESQAPGLLPFTPLIKPPAGMAPERWVQECVDATRAAPVDQHAQEDLLYGLALFGGIMYEPQVLKRLVPEVFMQESKTYQYLREEILREAAINYISAALKERFPADIVNALTPVIRNIGDLQRLEVLHTAAMRVPTIEAFAQMLNE